MPAASTTAPGARLTRVRHDMLSRSFPLAVVDHAGRATLSVTGTLAFADLQAAFGGRPVLTPVA